MLTNLRNALMTGKRLPYDAQLEYLESTGTQHVKLPVRPSSDCDISVDFQVVTFGQGAPFGGGDGNLSNEILVLPRTTTATSTDWIYRCGNKQNQAGLSVSYYDRHTIRWLFNSAYLDGALVSDITAANAFTATRDYMGLFCSLRNGDTSPTFMFKGRIFSCKIYVGGVLVRDFIPVRKGTVGYLYDRVSGRLFGNAGTGDFVLGPDVVPVEYIKSHGTEWIDTWLVSTSSSTWVCDCALDYAAGTASAYIGQTYKTASGGGSPRFTFGRTRSTNRWYCGIGNLNSGTEMPVSDGNRHTFTLDAPNKAFKVDSNSYAMNWSTFVLPTTIGCGLGLFARSYLDTNGKASAFAVMRLWGSRHYSAGELANKFLPVRVGTDATSWEGAMMDVLTRRIYRNDGTGAFGYGNDLKYPIPAE